MEAWLLENIGLVIGLLAGAIALRGEFKNNREEFARNREALKETKDAVLKLVAWLEKHDEELEALKVDQAWIKARMNGARS